MTSDEGACAFMYAAGTRNRPRTEESVFDGASTSSSDARDGRPLDRDVILVVRKRDASILLCNLFARFFRRGKQQRLSKSSGEENKLNSCAEHRT